MVKGFTVRLSDEDAAELEAVARVDGVPVAEEIRRAIGDLVAERRAAAALHRGEPGDPRPARPLTGAVYISDSRMPTFRIV
jgi:hypothetical protein